MEWTKLLSHERERESSAQYDPFRNTFDKDYERIIGSSSLRRLQDKAQVFPLQQNDFTRTRLTHSLEVSSIGRSIGKRIGYRLKELGILQNEQNESLASLLAVAGLVHDLGNPPFGHYGEDIIREWFKDNCGLFEAQQWLGDYIYFDGNAQTIRILSRLQFLHDRHGMNFSFGTLGTLLKYPWTSAEAGQRTKKKIGYFITEKELIEKVLQATGMKSSGEILRHPATYLLEAADDIAYLFADLEDTAKKGYLPWESIKNDLLKEADKAEGFKHLRQKLETISEKNDRNKVPVEESINNEVMDFRVFCQGVCIQQVCREFENSYDAIMQGQYQGELLNCSSTKDIIRKMRDVCKEYAYSNNEVLSLELIGKSVLTSLLDKFIKAVMDEENYLQPRCESGKLYRLISKNFKHIQKLNEESNYIEETNLTVHQRIQLVVDFISCMTDSYALNLHKSLLGVALP